MKKINESFMCLWCGKEIPPASKTCRNHCPYCFVSQHVDWAIPWDRVAKDTCWGRMYPVEYEIKNGVTKIHFICEKCQKSHRNKSSSDDKLSDIDKYIWDYKKYFWLNIPW